MLNLRSILVSFLFLPLLVAQAESGADLIKASGVKGGFIRFVSPEDGSQTGEIKLDTRPVFDGMSAAHGRLFIALKDGRVLCLK